MARTDDQLVDQIAGEACRSQLDSGLETAIRKALRAARLDERQACACVCEQLGETKDGSSEGYEGACAAEILARP